MKKSLSHGKVAGIYIPPARGQCTQSVERVHVIPWVGIVGDRYYHHHAQVYPPYKTGLELTLIENESIEVICHQDGIPINLAQARRNIITHRISLNHQVGKYFHIEKNTASWCTLMRTVQLYGESHRSSHFTGYETPWSFTC